MTVSVKSLQKQLIAAVAMVLVAMIALGSSTYAWFASNNMVKAEGMSVTAVSDTLVLQISNADKSAWGSAANAKTATANLYPATYKAPADDTWQYGYSDSAASHVLNAAGLQDVDAGSVDKYRLTNTFYCQTADGSVNAKDLKVDSVTVTAASTDNLHNAVRVLVVCGSNWIVYDAAGNITDNSAGDTTSIVLSSTVGTSGTPTEVKAYIYFEGGDASVYTNNATSLAGESVVISFTATANV